MNSIPDAETTIPEYSVDALVALASSNGLIDEHSAPAPSRCSLAVVVNHPEAQETTAARSHIVGDLFRTDLVSVTVATELLDLAQWARDKAPLLEGSLEKPTAFCDVTRGCRSALVSAPSGDALPDARQSAPHGCIHGNELKILVFAGVLFLLVFIDVRSPCLSGQFGFRHRICITRHTKTATR